MPTPKKIFDRPGRRRTTDSMKKRGSPLRRHSNISKEYDAPSTRPFSLRRQDTPELEVLEQGKQDDSQGGGISVFDAIFPSSTSQTFDDVNGIMPTPDRYEESDCLLESDVSDDEQQKESHIKRRKSTGMDVDKYMSRRQMTPFQERMNAITVIPGAFYCFLLLLSGGWLSQTSEDEVLHEMMSGEDMAFDESHCISSSWLPHLHALPPLPVVACAVGIIAHAPFSFIYHWSYAHRLPAGFARTNHWSRRMDQGMIHFCSACMAYATSGRFDFFLANALFNADCFYRQFKPVVRPRRNQIRIFISVVAYTIPILRRGDLELFANLWVVYAISFLLFGLYPIGGWSHSAFHLVIALVPPMLMDAATDLPASQPQLKLAAQCAAMAKQTLVP